MKLICTVAAQNFNSEEKHWTTGGKQHTSGTEAQQQQSSIMAGQQNRNRVGQQQQHCSTAGLQHTNTVGLQHGSRAIQLQCSTESQQQRDCRAAAL